MVYLGFGFPATEAIIVALAVLTALGLYNTVSTRMRRALRGRQPARRSVAQQCRPGAPGDRTQPPVAGGRKPMDGVAQSRARAAIDPLAVEISELGTLVRQLAETVATYEARFGEIATAETGKPGRSQTRIAKPLPLPEPIAASSRSRRCGGHRARSSPTPIAAAAPPAPEPRPNRRSLPRSSLPKPPTPTADEERLAVIRTPSTPIASTSICSRS